jgi:hypothetical protein
VCAIDVACEATGAVQYNVMAQSCCARSCVYTMAITAESTTCLLTLGTDDCPNGCMDRSDGGSNAIQHALYLVESFALSIQHACICASVHNGRYDLCSISWRDG